jgi:hypothetical protein
VSIAQEMGRTRGLLPELANDFGYGEAHVARTHLAILDAGERSERQLDVQVVFPVRVDELPIVGGGGDFTLALGDGGELIRVHGCLAQRIGCVRRRCRAAGAGGCGLPRVVRGRQGS